MSVVEDFAKSSPCTDRRVTRELSVLLRTGTSRFLKAVFRGCEVRSSSLAYFMGKLDDLADFSKTFSPEDDATLSTTGRGNGPIGTDHILLRL